MSVCNTARPAALFVFLLVEDGIRRVYRLNVVECSWDRDPKIFNAGKQSEFIEILQNERMEQLRQRVTASTHLGPLKKDETEEYINYRLLVAGWSGVGLLFSSEACALIHDLTEGVPRRINVFCDRILLYGFLEEIERFSIDDINNVADELSNEITSPIRKKEFDETVHREVPTQQEITKTEPKVKKKPKTEPKVKKKLKTEQKPVTTSASIKDTSSNSVYDAEELMQDLEIMSKKLDKQFDDIIKNFNKK